MYSEVLWEHFHSPHNNHRPEHFHARARKVNPVCPDVVEIFVTLAGQDRVEQMNFVAQACPPVIAVASLLCEWSTGRSLQEVSALTQEDLSNWVGPLPPNKRHAVQLTFLALQELLSPRSFNPVVEGV